MLKPFAGVFVLVSIPFGQSELSFCGSSVFWIFAFVPSTFCSFLEPVYLTGIPETVLPLLAIVRVISVSK